MAIRVTAEQAAARWLARMGQARENYIQGTNNPARNPMTEAIANGQRYIDGVTQAYNDGKWARGLRRVDLEEWKRLCREFGAARLASGAQKAQGKVQRFFQEFMPFLQGVLQRFPKRPNETLEDRITRAGNIMRAMAGFRRGGASGTFVGPTLPGVAPG